MGPTQCSGICLKVEKTFIEASLVCVVKLQRKSCGTGPTCAFVNLA